ncbi:hypothetical protein [Sphingomonas sp. SRS2]|uniref:hypothetical protein n=1 Tax=Sphingomonas sp. SRS2 TaxID=133190 RepID=UPI0006184206|nr:hypothetical protein [Sphingomonas sp. SRS2]KKC26059.1 hypothetical protein WP12_10630 [Sphingomonas sp. SRS2]
MKLVVDLQSISRDHIPFNTAFLKLLRQAARNEPIAMLCRQDHADAIAPYVADDDIRFLALPSHLHEPPRGRFVRFNEREQHAFVETIWRQTSADHLILLGCRADMLERLRRRPPPVAMDVVLHATLAEGIKWRSRNPLRRRRDMFATLRRRFPSTVRLIFLEQGIADRARPLIGRDTQYAILPHPIVGSPMETAPGPDRHMIKVGFLGEDAMGKGFAHFMELARHAPPHLQLRVEHDQDCTYPAWRR